MSTTGNSKDSASQRRGSDIPTGYQELDNLTGGLRSGMLYVVMGRYQMGHQTLTLNIAGNIVTLEEQPALIVTLGEDPAPLRMEMICGDARIWMKPDGGAVLKDEQDYRRMKESEAALAFGKKLILDTNSYPSSTELRERLSPVVRDRGVKLVVIRNFQWLLAEAWTPQYSEDEFEFNDDDKRAFPVASLSQELKSMARELDVPVVVNVDIRKGPCAPTMEDLEDFGYLENNADMVLSVHRDEKRDHGVAVVRVVKDRHGDYARFNLAYLKQYRRFENYVLQPVARV